jgi:hypothetical protein
MTIIHLSVATQGELTLKLAVKINWSTPRKEYFYGINVGEDLGVGGSGEYWKDKLIKF